MMVTSKNGDDNNDEGAFHLFLLHLSCNVCSTNTRTSCCYELVAGVVKFHSFTTLITSRSKHTLVLTLSVQLMMLDVAHMFLFSSLTLL